MLVALEGVRVLEVGSNLAAHFVGRQLAELGAEVLKVEPPGGDPSRRRGPFVRDVPHQDGSATFLYLNVGKRGVTLNQSTPTGREILGNLAAGSDIVLWGDDIERGRAAAEGVQPGRTAVWLLVSPYGASAAPFQLRSAHRSERTSPTRRPLKQSTPRSAAPSIEPAPPRRAIASNSRGSIVDARRRCVARVPPTAIPASYQPRLNRAGKRSSRASSRVRCTSAATPSWQRRWKARSLVRTVALLGDPHGQASAVATLAGSITSSASVPGPPNSIESRSRTRSCDRSDDTVDRAAPWSRRIPV